MSRSRTPDRSRPSIATIHADLAAMGRGELEALAERVRVAHGSLGQESWHIHDSGPYEAYTGLHALARVGSPRLAKIERFVLWWMRPQPGPLDLSPLRDAPALRAIHLKNTPADLGALRPVAELKLHGLSAQADLAPLRGWPLESLDLADRALTAAEVGILAGPPRLARLRCGAAEDPGALPEGLEELELERWDRVNLEPLARLRRLKHLSLGECPSLADASALAALPLLEKVRIKRAPRLGGLPGLAGLPALRFVELEGCGQLHDLDGLSGCARLSWLALEGCPNLRSIGALATCSNLSHVGIKGCANIRDLFVLAELPELDDIELSGASPEIGAYERYETEPLREDLRRMRERHEALCQGAPPVVRARELLLEDEPGLRQQAVELLRGAGPALAAEVLAGCRIDEEGWVYVPFCKHPTEALVRAILDARGGPPLRTLRLGGLRLASLRELEGLAGLEELAIADAPELTDLSPLAGLPGLRRLSLLRCWKLADFSRLLAALPRLRSLEVSECSGLSDLRPLAALAGLRELRLGEEELPVDLVTQAALRRLRALRVREIADLTSLRQLAALEDLEELAIEQAPRLGDLSLAEGQLPRLRSLSLGRCQLESFAPLAALRSLEELAIDGEGSPADDAHHLASLPRLRSLALSSFPWLVDLSWLAGLPGLRALALREIAGEESLRRLAGCPALEELTVERWQALLTLDGLEGCTQLRRLHVKGGELRCLDPIISLPALEELSLRGLSDVDAGSEIPDALYLDPHGESGRLRPAEYQGWLRELIAQRLEAILAEARRLQAEAPWRFQQLTQKVLASENAGLIESWRRAGYPTTPGASQAAWKQHRSWRWADIRAPASARGRLLPVDDDDIPF